MLRRARPVTVAPGSSTRLLPPSEITPPGVYRQRRKFLAAAGGLALAAGAAPARAALDFLRAPRFGEALTPLDDIRNYANFAEFGTNKQDPSIYAHKLPTRPWTVSIEGLVQRPKQLGFEDILKLAPLEERIYRLRCIEAWSMVIPWVGFPMSVLLKQVEPLGSAKYVEFESFYDEGLMSTPLLTRLEFPYLEGLRIDEAMHPLTLAAVGLYGDVLPNENGAPIRLVVPWKYGIKSAKSIVRIRFVEEMPLTSWRKVSSREHGFYANVNPDVDHPRWSQARERPIGEFFKRETLMFNGYGEQVAQLYAGMDLRRSY